MAVNKELRESLPRFISHLQKHVSRIYADDLSFYNDVENTPALSSSSEPQALDGTGWALEGHFI